MSCHILRDDKGRCHTIVTMANIFQYKGFLFEFHHFLGPAKVNKDFEPSARQGLKFYRAIDEWIKLSKEEKEETRILG